MPDVQISLRIQQNHSKGVVIPGRWFLVKCRRLFTSETAHQVMDARFIVLVPNRTPILPRREKFNTPGIFGMGK